MLRKVSRNIFAWVVVLMTILGMTSMNMVTAKAADENQASVTFSDVAYDVNTELYTIVGPTLNVPAGKTVKYVTINVANGTFNTSAISNYGTHHYNSGGTMYAAFSDLIILNDGYNTEAMIKEMYSSITFRYDKSSNSSSANGIAIYSTMSTNDISLPSTNFSFYQVPGQDHYYMYVPAANGNIVWHTAYNEAKSIIFGGLRGYLATIADVNENNLMRNLNGTDGAWVGGTSLYKVPSGDANSSFSTWVMFNDDNEITKVPSTGGAYASSHGKSTASQIWNQYYWACGPEAQTTVSRYIWTSGEPNGSGTAYSNEINRIGYTSTEDCAYTNDTGGLMNDYSENHAVLGYFAEFTASESYANGIAGMTYDQWKKGNASATFVATKEIASSTNVENQVAFKKYLIMNTDANVPNVGFNFSITAGTQVTDANGKILIHAGDEKLRVNGTPVLKTVSGTYNAFFTASKTAITSTDATTYGTVQLAKENDVYTEKYAVTNGIVDFSNVSFSEPGVYRYILKETTPNYTYTENDTSTLYMDVYVESNNDNDNLVVATDKTVFHSSATDTVSIQNGVPVSSGKVDGFVNRYLTDNLSVKKTVSGNQSRTDQYFTFNLNITNAIPGTIYNIALGDGQTAIESGKTSTTELASGTDGKATATFYLKAGQTFTIKGLSRGTAYTVGEDSAQLTDTGYKSTLASITGDKVNGLTGSTLIAMSAANQIIDGGISENTDLVVNNEKIGIIPTGVIIAVAPYATIALAGFFGLIVFARHKKSKDDEEEDQ